MDYRKIIGFGNSSFVISLPKNWLRNNGLSKGDTVYLDTNSSQIVMYPNDASFEKKEVCFELDVTGLKTDMIERKIVSAYINNADVITITGGDLVDKVKKIKSMIQKMVAMETVDQSTSKLVARSFLSLDEVDVNNLIRKTHHLISSMFDDVDSVLNEVEISENITERDEDVNKLCFLIFRSLNNEKAIKTGSLSEILRKWTLTFCLEEVADEVKRIARMVSFLDKNKVSEAMEIFKEVRNGYKKSMKGYFTDDKTLIYEVGKNKRKLLRRCNELLGENIGDGAMVALIEEIKDLIVRVHNQNKSSY